MTRAALLTRVQALCEAAPFGFRPAPSPFSFDQVPDGTIDGAYRVTVEPGEVRGWSNYAEERIDQVVVWLARVASADGVAAHGTVTADLDAVYRAVVRDGDQVSGDYTVPDGMTLEVTQEPGQLFLVGRLAVPVNYEVTL